MLVKVESWNGGTGLCVCFLMIFHLLTERVLDFWLTNWTSRHPRSVTGVKRRWLHVFIVSEQCVTARDVSEASFMPTQDLKCDGTWRSPAPWPGQTQMEKTGRHGWLYEPRGLEERRLCAILPVRVGMDVLRLTTHSFFKEKWQKQYFSSLWNWMVGKLNRNLARSRLQQIYGRMKLKTYTTPFFVPKFD